MAHPIHDPRNQRIAALLADLRKRRGLLQEDVAERLHRPQSFVSKYESGMRRVDLVELLDILGALETDPHEFIDQVLAGPIRSLPR
ncbi:helix-turn-helix domain-containing protein [Paraburkholderia kururiensis]|uniref:Helix-turn-helix transcriptional regulator n=1 Tax=Paraburkholderia kururiensis TaxID=984307 RepID=A0ABZ0WDW6_9BURK|nr:helix-turn-helix transcriptional regulator [Paraburkholderia kururiensis]WQD75524.1 helix-turn-helix transcriptional regulator [Paraburkholderia kururiensis]